ncbi:hypothetical protein ASE75_09825 [Sphingomonas sp. Leaf17]|uniref:TMEM165/GDT1 family protein n=1 Tax=Sphingomonas sp. Leaf17 TaxID=1735683 RepID=UPI0006F20ED4|nr:TMEM165/GDT1 family protein [Sphingomonas sp. Leaf17]KQM64277.1 hypothetical protein ASE75_09825 [Sphingomonas sp. Leaf17]
MDVLMAALVVAALAQIGDRTAWLAAILADRYRRPGIVIAMAGVALAAAGALAVIAAMLVAPMLSPRARDVLLGLALLLQGGGALFPAKAPARLTGWRIGVALTSLLGLFILAFGDGIQFVVMALAARSPLPWAAALGSTIGSLAVVAVAVTLGEAGWQRLPLARIRLVVAVMMLVAGLVMGLRGVGLI